MSNPFLNTPAPMLSVKNPGELLAIDDFPDTDKYLLDGVLARGQYAVIQAPAGIGKSRFTIQLVSALITGHEFIGQQIICRNNLKVLLIQAENNNNRLKSDMKAIHAWLRPDDWNLIKSNLLIHTLEEDHDTLLNINERMVKESIGRLIKKVRPDIVVFDPLYSFAKSGSLNTDVGMLETVKEMAKLARLGKPDCSVIVVHHSKPGKAGTKNATGWNKGIYGSGSNALHRWTRGEINIATATPNDNTRLVVTCGKNSNGPEFQPFGIKLNTNTMIYERDTDFDLDTWQVSLAATPTSRFNVTPQDIARLVEIVPLRRADLVRAVMECGCSKSTAYTLLGQAVGKTIRVNQRGEFEYIGNLETGNSGNPISSGRIIRIPA